MPATIIARASTLAANRAATFCTSARMMKPAEAAASTSTAASGSSWAWRNLSPQTRTNVKIFGAVCVATDAFVLYNYPELVGLKKSSE